MCLQGSREVQEREILGQLSLSTLQNHLLPQESICSSLTRVWVWCVKNNTSLSFKQKDLTEASVAFSQTLHHLYKGLSDRKPTDLFLFLVPRKPVFSGVR